MKLHEASSMMKLHKPIKLHKLMKLHQLRQPDEARRLRAKRRN